MKETTTIDEIRLGPEPGYHAESVLGVLRSFGFSFVADLAGERGRGKLSDFGVVFLLWVWLDWDGPALSRRRPGCTLMMVEGGNRAVRGVATPRLGLTLLWKY